MLVLVQSGFGEEAQVSLSDEDALVGSGPGATIRLAEAGLPDRAAVFRRGPEGWRVEMLDREYPARLNGVPISGPTMLSAGDTLELGGYRLELVSGATEPLVHPLEPSSISALPEDEAEDPAIGLSFADDGIAHAEMATDADVPLSPDHDGKYSMGLAIPRGARPESPLGLKSLEESSLSIRPLSPQQVDPPGVSAGRPGAESLGMFTVPPGTIKRKNNDPVNLDAGHVSPFAVIARHLPTIEDPHHLIKVWHRLARKTFGAGMTWMALRSNSSGPLQVEDARDSDGEQIHRPELVDLLLDTCLLREQFVLLPGLEMDGQPAVMAGPVFGPKGVLGMALLQAASPTSRLSARDLEFFRVVLGVFGAQVSHLLYETSEDGLSSSAAQHKLLQQMLYPSQWPTVAGVSVFHRRINGTLEATDLTDAAPTPDGRLALLMASVDRSAPSNPVLLAQARGAFRTAVANGLSCASALISLNRAIHERSRGYWSMDAAMLIYDPQTRVAQMAQAGMPGMRLIGQDRVARQLRHEGQPAIGIRPDTVYHNFNERFNTTDLILLYSNGITQLANAEGESFGRKRLVETILQFLDRPTDEILERLIQRIRQFVGAERPGKDITMLLINPAQRDVGDLSDEIAPSDLPR